MSVSETSASFAQDITGLTTSRAGAAGSAAALKEEYPANSRGNRQSARQRPLRLFNFITIPLNKDSEFVIRIIMMAEIINNGVQGGCRNDLRGSCNKVLIRSD
jgi:hypothetical protein